MSSSVKTSRPWSERGADVSGGIDRRELIRGTAALATMSALVGRIAAAAEGEPLPTPAEELLSPRQRAVARAAARGKSIALIASELRLQPETVRTHLRDVYRRLGVSQRAELARLLLPG